MNLASLKKEWTEEYQIEDEGVNWLIAEVERLQVERTQVEQFIRDYHFALDNREHGGVAESMAFDCICAVMGLQWVQGEEKRRRTKEE